MPNFVKLSELVDDDFIVIKSWGFKFKKWDDASKKMLVSDTYQEGYRKTYNLETSKGSLDLGSGQLANMLESVFRNGQADIINKCFKVKSNGKSGMDIRYYINPVYGTPPPVSPPAPQEVKEDVVAEVDPSKEINLDDIPL